MRHFNAPSHRPRAEYLEGQDRDLNLIRELDDDFFRPGILCGRAAQRAGQCVGVRVGRDLVTGAGEDMVVSTGDVFLVSQARWLEEGMTTHD